MQAKYGAEYKCANSLVISRKWLSYAKLAAANSLKQGSSFIHKICLLYLHERHTSVISPCYYINTIKVEARQSRAKEIAAEV